MGIAEEDKTNRTSRERIPKQQVSRHDEYIRYVDLRWQQEPPAENESEKLMSEKYNQRTNDGTKHTAE